MLLVLLGGVRVVENPDSGKRTTPSMVAYTEKGAVLCGEPARRQYSTNREGSMLAIKRYVGMKMDSLKKSDRPAYELVAGKNGYAWVSVRGSLKSVSQVQAETLKTMMNHVRTSLGPEMKIKGG